MKRELKTAIILATTLFFLTSSCNYMNNYQTRPNIVFIIADDLSFGIRPEYELYNLENDPYQMQNLAFHQDKYSLT